MVFHTAHRGQNAPQDYSHATCREENLANLLANKTPVLGNHREGTPRILVLKVGTSTLMDSQKHCVCLSNVGRFADVVCDLKDRGYHVVMISSGAVGAGCIHMHMKTRPSQMVEKQAVSAIGQSRIVRLWEDIFAIKERKIAQLLLTRHDLMDRPRFVNFRNTLLQLLSMDVIPVINENDALATEGLKFGDNDTLGAYVSISIGATWFFMLTDVDCLFTGNPRYHPGAQPIAFVRKIDAVYKLLDQSNENEGTQWGSGGMRTKIIAAKLTCATGVHTALCHGRFPERILDIISFAESGAMGKSGLGLEELSTKDFPIDPICSSKMDMLQIAAKTQFTAAVAEHCSPDESLESSNSAKKLVEDEPNGPLAPRKKCSQPSLIMFPDVKTMPYIGTIFMGQPCTQSLRDQRRWILSLPVRGKVFADENCVRAVIEKRKSLFAAGIVTVEGQFFPGEAVALYPAAAMGDIGRQNHELARFITNFSSQELSRIQGRKTADFQNILGYYCAHEVAHRSNIIFVDPSPVFEKYSIDINDSMTKSEDEDE